MTKTELVERIKELKKEILYEKRRMTCCAYSNSDMLKFYSLEQELKDLEEKYKKS